MAELRRPWSEWEPIFHDFLQHSVAAADPAHDGEHTRRVVANAQALAQAETADLAIVLPAAWLHDCVVVPKSSPKRYQASTLAANRAQAFLHDIAYPQRLVPAIWHAIAAHSFSAQIPPQTREAMVVQDADRLDSLGAIGLARCLMLGGALGRQLYDVAEPLPRTRPLDDQRNTLDHLYIKLFHLADSMCTAAGRAEARTRTAFLHDFVAQLQHELRLATS